MRLERPHRIDIHGDTGGSSQAQFIERPALVQRNQSYSGSSGVFGGSLLLFSFVPIQIGHFSNVAFNVL